MTTEQPTIDFEAPGEADKNFYLMMANRRYMKEFLMPNIRVFMADHPDKTARSLIQKIDETNRAAFNAITNLGLYMKKQKISTPESDANLKRVEELFMDCATLPLVTPVEKMDDLAALVDNFRAGAYSRTGGELINAIQSAPDNYNAQVYAVIHTYMPDTDTEQKKALAVAIEQLFHIRNQVGF